MNKIAPKGILKVIEVRQIREENTMAVYVIVTVEAVDGSRWEFTASSMRTAMKPKMP